MTAGRGIVHSERSPNTKRSRETRLHGIQTWIALPEEHEETEPWFRHYSATDIPTWQDGGVEITLIAGQVYGRTSPVQTFSPMIYLDVQLPTGTQFTLPPDYSEQAVYSVTNGLSIDGEPLEPQRMIVLNPNQTVSISAKADARCIVVGGEPVDPELVLQQLDELGSPTSIAQAGSRFFGLVTGGSLPAALAANWLAAASLLVLDYSSLAQAMVTLPMGVLATSSRNKVLLLLAYTTGLRVSEICGLIIINPLPSLWTE